MDIGSYTQSCPPCPLRNSLVPILISVDIGSYTGKPDREYVDTIFCSNPYFSGYRFLYEEKGKLYFSTNWVPILISVDIGSYTAYIYLDIRLKRNRSNPYFSGYRFLYMANIIVFYIHIGSSNPYFSGYRFLYIGLLCHE